MQYFIVLWIASLLCFLAWKPIGNPPQDINLYLACVLIVVVFLQATFNFYQEYQANTGMYCITHSSCHVTSP
jgi:sodium/potassium-transporting ATPase subunit alpha